MTNIELESILNRVNGARRGPWKSYVEGRDFTSGSNFIMIGKGEDRGTDIELIGATIEDQNFIAEARQDIPLLVNEVKRLKRLIEELKNE